MSMYIFLSYVVETVFPTCFIRSLQRISLNILNSCPTQGRVEGWDAMKPLHYRSVSSKGAGQPRLTHHHRGGWIETKWMIWVWRNGGMKFVVGENGRNPVKTYPDPVSSTAKPTWRDRDVFNRHNLSQSLLDILSCWKFFVYQMDIKMIIFERKMFVS